VENLSNTGEHQHSDSFDIYALEHLHRYAIAMSFCNDQDVLDIASGEGYGSNLLASVAKVVHGVDISNDAIEHAKTKYVRSNLTHTAGSASHIPLPPKSVDRVISFETLEHHDLHEEMFTEVKRVLRPNGYLMMSTPDKLNYSDIPKQKNEFHVKELYLEEFRSLAKRHFKHVSLLYQTTGYFGLIIPELVGNHPFRFYEGDFSAIENTKMIPSPVYNICLASDAELPESTMSAYSGHQIMLSLLKQAEEVTRLQEIVENFNSVIRDLKASQSYRIGRKVTYPYRLVQNLFGKT